jgi:shikimate 5-dehydrogenase
MNDGREVYVVGAGGHAKVVVSTLQAAGYTVKGLFDDDPEKGAKSVLCAPVLGPTAEFGLLKHRRAVISVGDNASPKDLDPIVHSHKSCHGLAALSD